MTSRTVLWACVAGLALPATAHAYEPRHVFITNRGGGNIVELDAAGWRQVRSLR